jgi:hypothetical protein
VKSFLDTSVLVAAFYVTLHFDLIQWSAGTSPLLLGSMSAFQIIEFGACVFGPAIFQQEDLKG